MARSDDYRAQLAALGLSSPELNELIDQAIRESWTSSEFEMALYASNTFKTTFPGIFRPDGSLYMDPLQYRATVDTYMDVAKRYGISMDAGRAGSLIHRQVSPDEFAVRAEAVYRVGENREMFKAFQQVLQSKGLKGINTDEEIADFMIGKADKKFYAIWEQTQIGGAANMAGVHLGSGMVRQIAKKIPGQEVDPAALAQNFANLAQNIRTTLPMSKIASFGLTKRDLVELEFGGSRQSAIADKVQRILNVGAGMQENKSNVQSNVTQGSRTGLSRQQQ